MSGVYIFCFIRLLYVCAGCTVCWMLLYLGVWGGGAIFVGGSGIVVGGYGCSILGNFLLLGIVFSY